MVVTSLEPVVAHADNKFLPVGAHVVSGGASFRVWAPDHQRLRVVVGAPEFATRYVECERDAEGFFSGRDEAGGAGDQYWLQVDGRLLPDPASRFQPLGVEAASQIVDPRTFRWQCTDWRRPPLRGRVIYELHVGTFTREGTFASVASRLDALADLGVNTIELMPLADFPGRWNWGYDGVMPFAPARCYGTPDDLRALVDAAHLRGLAVIIDVVYNHLGPCGNVLPALSRRYFHEQRATGWGQALNFDEPGSVPVRHFFLQNACMWFDEYRVDGLRLDAVHAIEDGSEPPIMAEVAAAAHARGAFVIAEDERNAAEIITPAAAGGWGVDGMWSDDFHHTARVALTGQREAHFAGYRGTLDECVETLHHGWLYRGQPFPPWGRPRGTPAAHLPSSRFVCCISNHDQVGNRPLGDRLNAHIPPESYRALSMLFLLLPYMPLLFMGQEWAASTPFPYFTDLPGEIGERMGEHRRREFAERGADYGEDVLRRMPDPQARTTFEAARLDWSEPARAPHAQVRALYRECLRLRAREIGLQSPARENWQVAKVAESVMGLRIRDAAGDWLLLSAFATPGMLVPGSDVFSSPGTGKTWVTVLSSNEPRFAGAALDVARNVPAVGTVLYRALQGGR